jgi:hypothetical protein
MFNTIKTGASSAPVTVEFESRGGGIRTHGLLHPKQNPTRSQILKKEDGKLEVIPNQKGKQRSIEGINRPVEMLRVMLNYAVDERIISPDQNPFSQSRPERLSKGSPKQAANDFLPSVRNWS